MSRIRQEVLGAPVDAVSCADALDYLSERIKKAKPPGAVLAMNPEKVQFLKENPHWRPFFARAALVIPDGIGVVIALRVLRGIRVSRVAGADLMQALCGRAVREGFSIFLYGAAEETSTKACRILLERHPSLQIVGRAHGFVKDDEHEAMLESIRRLKPDIVFVALGSPRQEKWISEHIEDLPVRIYMGIGGTLDAIAGNVKRAPAVFRAVGLEWFYRLLQQPMRVGRQKRLLYFAADVVLEKLGR